MTIRSKFLAATLGFVIASGAIGGAFAQSGHAAANVSVASAKAPTPGTHHRLRIAHLGTHRATSHGTFAKTTAAKTTARAHVAVAHGLRGRIARHSVAKTRLVRSHGAKTHLVTARIGKTHLVTAHVAKTRLVKSTLIGTQKHAMAGKSRVIR